MRINVGFCFATRPGSDGTVRLVEFRMISGCPAPCPVDPDAVEVEVFAIGRAA